MPQTHSVLPVRQGYRLVVRVKFFFFADGNHYAEGGGTLEAECTPLLRLDLYSNGCVLLTS